jgi:aspartate 1-decarboxylase
MQLFRTMMKSKLHQATVTEANLNYVGSITIDEDLMDAVDLLPNEHVQIVNNHNGARFETYVITGARGSGVICLNGAAARLVQLGDTVIIIGYAMMTDEQAKNYHPKVAILDQQNQVKELLPKEVPGTGVSGHAHQAKLT